MRRPVDVKRDLFAVPKSPLSFLAERCSERPGAVKAALCAALANP
jgi:hypothetical protein